MAESLTLRVSTPEATLLEAAGVRSAQVRLADGGSIGIRPGHAPLLAETVAGPVAYTDDAGEHTFYAGPGILEVHRDGVDVLTTGSQAAREAEGVPLADRQRFDRLARSLLGRLRADPAAYGGPDRVEGER